ncbi:BQ2448_4721 [Microbotryum intermedium]|uniref:ubiquitinyl hydrolase 1 n=1 Tax=Microbotryum intermedium TaxID=269621 RepID=A0A238FFL6_9BASI|nr:BQ2448_4721 [Microbotryum intermedium]
MYVLVTAELIPFIFHERCSSPASNDWGHHALNNLVQQASFRQQDLAGIARAVGPEQHEDDDDDDDNEERWLKQARRHKAKTRPQQNRYATPPVMKEALGIRGLGLAPCTQYEAYKCHPEMLSAFMLTDEGHWVTIRRKGYAVFVCAPTTASGLPPCRGLASTSSRSLLGSVLGSDSTSTSNATPGPSSSNLDAATFVHTHFDDRRQARVPSNGKGKRRLSDAENSTHDDGDDDVVVGDGDNDDDDIIIVEDFDELDEGRLNPSTKRTRGGEAKRKKLRAEYDGGGGGAGEAESSSTPPMTATSTSNSTFSAAPTPNEWSEEDQMSRAIAESMKAARDNSASTSNQRPVPTSETTEDLELQRALKASLLDDVEVDEDDHALDDTPSMEELRRRRMNRFALR